jgi:hypothetical protein
MMKIIRRDDVQLCQPQVGLAVADQDADGELVGCGGLRQGDDVAPRMLRNEKGSRPRTGAFVS